MINFMIKKHNDNKNYIIDGISSYNTNDNEHYILSMVLAIIILMTMNMIRIIN